uniref:RanBP2-type domain-containing protein n=1 Tax=Entomoneis paludosa TaxID=265537 RepID=A0A7S2Y2K5_9STRA
MSVDLMDLQKSAMDMMVREAQQQQQGNSSSSAEEQQPPLCRSGTMVQQTIVCDGQSVMSDLTDEREVELRLLRTMALHRNRWNLASDAATGKRPLLRKDAPVYTPAVSPLTSTSRGVETRRVEIPPCTPPLFQATRTAPPVEETAPVSSSPEKPTSAAAANQAPSLPLRRSSVKLPVFSSSVSTFSIPEDEPDTKQPTLLLSKEKSWVEQETSPSDVKAIWNPSRASPRAAGNPCRQPQRRHTGSPCGGNPSDFLRAAQQAVREATEASSTSSSQEDEEEDCTWVPLKSESSSCSSSSSSSSSSSGSATTITSNHNNNGWVCDHCTFHNAKMDFLTCEMCQMVRLDTGGSQDAVEPAPAPVSSQRVRQDRERQLERELIKQRFQEMIDLQRKEEANMGLASPNINGAASADATVTCSS